MYSGSGIAKKGVQARAGHCQVARTMHLHVWRCKASPTLVSVYISHLAMHSFVTFADEAMTNHSPSFAMRRYKGKHLTPVLELKLLADIGLVGAPNVGKRFEC
jgi:hypothetical protein